MKEFEIIDGILIKYNGNASHVVIPDGVTNIGSYAFQDCKCLTSIEIPNSVNRIGTSAFRGCTALTDIEIPNSVTWIGIYAFSGCTNIKNIEIPKSVAIIGEHAFQDCRNVKNIKIPNSVTYIGGYAFDGCTSLNNIEIPNSVKYIGGGAFERINKVKPQYNKNGSLRAYKAFNRNWACKYYFQYEVGKSYHQDGEINCCRNGFHACPNPLSVFNYYAGFLADLHFAEVELSGDMDWEFDKVAASDIKIVRELSASELAEIYNKMEKL